MRIAWIAPFAFIAALIAFGPALSAPFGFDDEAAILHNRSIRQAWPPSALVSTPGLGTAVSGRPVANYSFALNYALNRLLGVEQPLDTDGSSATAGPNATVGYHLVNTLVHVLCALLIFALVRRTFRVGRVPEDWRDSGDRIAALVAGVWLIHPIQTEAVDYLSQRTELLVSLWSLITIYAVIRVWEENRCPSDRQERRVVAWSLTAIAACVLGMGTKEVMLGVPLLAVLFDRAFLATSWRELWTTAWRRRLYIALFATYGLSAYLILSGARAATVGFHLRVTPWEYLYSQGWAIPHYVKLFIWPDMLAYDYGSNPVRNLTAAPGFAALIVAGGATLVAWSRSKWHWAGFLGAWFFLLLAPSSSVVPIQTEIAAERRSYLALVALIVAVVVGAEALRRRFAAAGQGNTVERRRMIAAVLIGVGVIYAWASGWAAERLAPNFLGGQLAIRGGIAGAAMLVAWALVFGLRGRVRLATVIGVAILMLIGSYGRSRTYMSVEALWKDAALKYPDNPRAINGVGVEELRRDPARFSEPDSLFRRALALDSTYVPVWVSRAAIAIKQDRLADAESLLTRALRIAPDDSAATERLGRVLVAAGHSERATPYLRRLVQWAPTSEALTNLGVAYLTEGQLDSATAVLLRAVQLDSSRTESLTYLGGALIERGRGAEALPFLVRAAQLDPSSGFTLALMSVAYAQAHQPTLANEAASAAIARAPGDESVYVFAGRGLEAIGRFRDAVTYLTEAVRLSPNDLQAVTRLAIANAGLGNRTEASRLLKRVLSVAPNYELARHALNDIERAHGP
ncbi:MAG: tetratricopeptide repeat protein [bacterium]